LRLQAGHLCPKERILDSSNDALISTTRDLIRKFEVLEGLSVFKDLHGHPVLKGDVGHVGIVLSPHMVGFMKPGKLWKKKRVTILSYLTRRPSWMSRWRTRGVNGHAEGSLRSSLGNNRTLRT
jgi:hypothetical protein